MSLSIQPTYNGTPAPGGFSALSATRILGAGRAEQAVPAQELTARLKLDPAICVITKQLVNASGNSGHSPMLLNTFVAG